MTYHNHPYDTLPSDIYDRLRHCADPSVPFLDRTEKLASKLYFLTHFDQPRTLDDAVRYVQGWHPALRPTREQLHAAFQFLAQRGAGTYQEAPMHTIHVRFRLAPNHQAIARQAGVPSGGVHSSIYHFLLANPTGQTLDDITRAVQNVGGFSTAAISAALSDLVNSMRVVTMEFIPGGEPITQPGPDESFYFVWTKPDPRYPESRRSPRKTFPTHDEALAAAQTMACRHPDQKFFVARAVTVIDRKVEVTTTPRSLA